MFTGIVEGTGKVIKIESEKSNKTLTIEHPFTDDLYIDQSISHNGVCLTIVGIENNQYKVVAIDETLNRSSLGELKAGDHINLERSMSASSRIDGHMVQGHVDCKGKVENIIDQNGSWIFEISYPSEQSLLLVEKGSVCVDGISLTVVKTDEIKFSIAIIPYTYNHTNMQYLKPGQHVNIEFDSIGKYVINYLKKINS